MKLSKLYKRDTKGKIREWEIEIEGNRYRVTSGLQDGQQVTNEWTECEGKNIGRANATTPEQQALLEATAKWQKQQDKSHYHEDVTKIDEEKFVKVMLATPYEKVKAKMDFEGAYIQPKLDGIRFFASKPHSHSRGGKQLGGMNIIRKEMDRLLNDHPEIQTDGEGYNHDYKDKFNELTSLIKRETITTVKEEEIREVLQYHIYDVLTIGDLTKDDPYNDRMTAFWDLIESDYPELKKWLKKVDYIPVTDHDEIKAYFESYVALGYEGAIVRYNCGYENKRSKKLIKIKIFDDAEFEIVEILEGRGNRAGMAGRILVRLDTDVTGEVTFKSGIKGGVKFYKQLWKEKDQLIGKTATIRFFGRNPDTDIPRFPVTVNVGRENYE